MKVSFIIPTYNEEKRIGKLLESIFSQDYPKKDFEVLVIDGRSNDKTIEIAKRYGAKILDNPKRVEENAYIIGIKKAEGEILCFTDADNVLVGKDWLTKMTKPFEDKEIVFADGMFYDYRKNDDISVKYQALIGGDDPFATYLGLYSRWCYFKNNWTDYPYVKEKKKGYWKCRLKNKKLIPSFSTNGLLIRKNILRKMKLIPFTEIDIFYRLINNGHNCFAKVNCGLIHNQVSFFQKKLRRISRRHDKEIKTEYHYGITNKKIILMALYVALIFPVFFDALRGFIKKPTSAWLFHPIACFGEFSIYFFYSYLYMHLIKKKPMGF
jgi:glycosyltransferase involved in cell wall biosynthesis